MVPYNPQLVESEDVELWKWKADYKVICGFSAVWAFVPQTPTLFKDQL